MGVIALLVADADPESDVVRIQPKGRLSDEFAAALPEFMPGASAGGQKVDPDRVGRFDRHFSVFNVEFLDLGAAGRVAVSFFDPVDQVLVGERIRLDHRPGEPAVARRVVVVSADADQPFARPHHFLIDVRDVFHIAVDLCCAVDDLKPRQPLELAAERVRIHRPVRVVEDHQHIPFPRRADDLVYPVDRVFADVVGIADVLRYVAVFLRVPPDVIQVAADHPDIVRILGIEVHMHLLRVIPRLVLPLVEGGEQVLPAEVEAVFVPGQRDEVLVGQIRVIQHDFVISKRDGGIAVRFVELFDLLRRLAPVGNGGVAVQIDLEEPAVLRQQELSHRASPPIAVFRNYYTRSRLPNQEQNCADFSFFEKTAGTPAPRAGFLSENVVNR